MKPEQQRIAIAQACGWKGISPSYLIGYAPWRPEPYSDRVNACPVDELECIPLDPLPDYLNDLNAMHEAEKLLTQEQARTYAGYLGETPQTGTWEGCSMWHFTAAQRAEAFLRTLNLWSE